jgi:hypothetical protein
MLLRLHNEQSYSAFGSRFGIKPELFYYFLHCDKLYVYSTSPFK